MEALGPGDPRSAGTYRLIARLGVGGMGRVYLGRSARGRAVAVKLVHPELLRDPGTRRRFRHEVDAARRVGGAFTAAVLDADTESDAPWVVTAYVPGPGLQDVVETHGPLPEASVLALASGLARALRAVHGLDLIHRDVKPSNVLVTIDGPKLIDFGIARSVDDGLGTRTGGVVGSPGFMSPEQVRGTPLTQASDVFSLGAVLAFAATGRHPFGDGGVHARMFRIATEAPDLGDLAGPVRNLVDRCLAKDPADRPGLDELLAGVLAEPPAGAWLPAAVMAELGRHAAFLLEVEDPADGGEPQPGTPPPPPPAAAPPPAGTSSAGTAPAAPGPATSPAGAPPRRRRRRSRTPAYLGLGAAATAVVVAAGLAFALLQNRNPDGGGRVGTGAASAPITAPAGAVPLDMVGTWEGRTGALDGPDSRVRRLTVRRGAVGDAVAVLHSAEGGFLCEYQGALEQGGPAVRLDMSNSRFFGGPEDCADRVEVSLTMEAGKIRWTGPEPAQSLTLARNHTVPERLRGVWQWGGPEGTEHRTIELTSDDVGTQTVGVAWTGPDGAPCATKALLLSAEKEIVFYAGKPQEYDRCETVGLQKLTPQGNGAARWESLTLGTSGPFRQYQH
ncbi:serine/threonine-protein kinase [Actinomadura sp. WMMB 499]|uniref:serine/threonine-protein kinase n=1 Tax=Actinomadura sp. WMMB 499 TaxID=1219491 RepID=UPI0012489716|nr:serine/threonine-protein kinase [Actinomadura sp. WMMB 499]QFG25248.1 serine/threonine protein kinase [Actinomadura sp. WMMB 499]